VLSIFGVLRFTRFFSRFALFGLRNVSSSDPITFVAHSPSSLLNDDVQLPWNRSLLRCFLKCERHFPRVRFHPFSLSKCSDIDLTILFSRNEPTCFFVYPTFRCCVPFDALRIDESFPRTVRINEKDVTILSCTFDSQLSIIVYSYLPSVSYRSVTVDPSFLLTYPSYFSLHHVILLSDTWLRSLPSSLYVILASFYSSRVCTMVYLFIYA